MIILNFCVGEQIVCMLLLRSNSTLYHVLKILLVQNCMKPNPWKGEGIFLFCLIGVIWPSQHQVRFTTIEKDLYFDDLKKINYGFQEVITIFNALWTPKKICKFVNFQNWEHQRRVAKALLSTILNHSLYTIARV